MKTELIEKEVRVRVKKSDGRGNMVNHDPIRYTDRIVQCFDLDYGRQRKERQARERAERNAEWRKMTPHEQLDDLDWRLGKGQGAQKQRARIAAQIAAKRETPKDKGPRPPQPKKGKKYRQNKR
jgi:hypothetical protein